MSDPRGAGGVGGSRAGAAGRAAPTDLRISAEERPDELVEYAASVGDDPARVDSREVPLALTDIRAILAPGTPQAAPRPRWKGDVRSAAEVGRRAPPRGASKELGRKLYDRLKSSVGVGYGMAFGTAATRPSVRILLNFTKAPRLAQLPWELLYDGTSFVALHEETPIVRWLDVRRRQPIPLAPGEKLRVLIAHAVPACQATLDDDHERDAIAAAIRGGSLEVDVRSVRATVQDVLDGLRDFDPHVFHFIGHGHQASHDRASALMFEGTNVGSCDAVTADALSAMLNRADGSLGLVFLNSCEGAASGTGDIFSGMAQAIVAGGVPAAVAMQFVIPDDVAGHMAAAFYGALARGMPVDVALTHARVRIAADDDTNWSTPVLYWRLKDGNLFVREPAEPARATAEPAPPPPAQAPTTPAEPPRAARAPRPRVAPAVAMLLVVIGAAWLLRPRLMDLVGLRPAGVDLSTSDPPPLRDPGPQPVPPLPPPDVAMIDVGEPTPALALSPDPLLPNAFTFASGAAEAPPIPRSDVERIDALLELDSDLVLRVTGSADAPGSAAWNQRLGRLRAESCRARLTEAGLDAGRIVTESIGETGSRGASARDRAATVTFTWRENGSVSFSEGGAEVPGDWLRRVDMGALERLAAFGLRLRIDAHARSDESEALATERALAVQGVLVGAGVPESLIEVVPRAPAVDAEAHAELSLVPAAPRSVPFAHGSTELDADDSALERLASSLEAMPDAVVTLAGLGDAASEDLERAGARAEAVRDALVSVGVTGERIELALARAPSALRPRGPLDGQAVEWSMRPAGVEPIAFGFDEDVPSSASAAALDELAAWMQAHRHASVVVEGHADRRGSDAYNDGLGARRARAVIAELGRRGVAVSRLRLVSFGSSRPRAADARREEEHALDRRVTVRIEERPWEW